MNGHQKDCLCVGCLTGHINRTSYQSLASSINNSSNSNSGSHNNNSPRTLPKRKQNRSLKSTAQWRNSNMMSNNRGNGGSGGGGFDITYDVDEDTELALALSVSQYEKTNQDEYVKWMEEVIDLSDDDNELGNNRNSNNNNNRSIDLEPVTLINSDKEDDDYIQFIGDFPSTTTTPNKSNSNNSNGTTRMTTTTTTKSSNYHSPLQKEKNNALITTIEDDMNYSNNQWDSPNYDDVLSFSLPATITTTNTNQINRIDLNNNDKYNNIDSIRVNDNDILTSLPTTPLVIDELSTPPTEDTTNIIGTSPNQPNLDLNSSTTNIKYSSPDIETTKVYRLPIEDDEPKPSPNKPPIPNIENNNIDNRLNQLSDHNIDSTIYNNNNNKNTKDGDILKNISPFTDINMVIPLKDSDNNNNNDDNTTNTLDTNNYTQKESIIEQEQQMEEDKEGEEEEDEKYKLNSDNEFSSIQPPPSLLLSPVVSSDSSIKTKPKRPLSIRKKYSEITPIDPQQCRQCNKRSMNSHCIYFNCKACCLFDFENKDKVCLVHFKDEEKRPTILSEGRYKTILNRMKKEHPKIHIKLSGRNRDHLKSLPKPKIPSPPSPPPLPLHPPPLLHSPSIIPTRRIKTNINLKKQHLNNSRNTNNNSNQKLSKIVKNIMNVVNSLIEKDSTSPFDLDYLYCNEIIQDDDDLYSLSGSEDEEENDDNNKNNNRNNYNYHNYNNYNNNNYNNNNRNSINSSNEHQNTPLELLQQKDNNDHYNNSNNKNNNNKNCTDKFTSKSPHIAQISIEDFANWLNTNNIKASDTSINQLFSLLNLPTSSYNSDLVNEYNRIKQLNNNNNNNNTTIFTTKINVPPPPPPVFLTKNNNFNKNNTNKRLDYDNKQEDHETTEQEQLVLKKKRLYFEK